jgi:hypothetical protein
MPAKSPEKCVQGLALGRHPASQRDTFESQVRLGYAQSEQLSDIRRISSLEMS